MTVSRSCSWCHEMNVIPESGIPICSKCHHRADLPRMDCDCPACFLPKSLDPGSVIMGHVLNQFAPMPYSLEVILGSVEVNLDVGSADAVLSVICPGDDEDGGQHIIDRGELLPLCDALMRLMTPTHRECLLAAIMLMR